MTAGSDSITYKDNSYIDGIIVKDTLALDSDAKIQVTNYTFLLATKERGF
jgi:hypothetical protein